MASGRTVSRYIMGKGRSHLVTMPHSRARRLESQSGRRPQGETLDAECWCRAEVVKVPRAAVLQCMTRSCGRPGCRPTSTPWKEG